MPGRSTPTPCPTALARLRPASIPLLSWRPVAALAALATLSACGKSKEAPPTAAEVSYAGEGGDNVAAVLEALQAQLAEVEARLDSLEQAAGAPRPMAPRARDVTWTRDDGTRRDVASALASLGERLAAVETGLEAAQTVHDELGTRADALEALHRCPEGAVALYNYVEGFAESPTGICMDKRLHKGYTMWHLAAQACVARGGHLCSYATLETAYDVPYENLYPDFERTGTAQPDPDDPSTLPGEWSADVMVEQGEAALGTPAGYSAEPIPFPVYSASYGEMGTRRYRCCYDR